MAGLANRAFCGFFGGVSLVLVQGVLVKVDWWELMNNWGYAVGAIGVVSGFFSWAVVENFRERLPEIFGRNF